MTEFCRCDTGPLTFRTMLSDPLIRLVMDRDGVSVEELVDVLEVARAAIVAREAAAVETARRN